MILSPRVALWAVWLPLYVAFWWWGILCQEAMRRGHIDDAMRRFRWAMASGSAAMLVGGLAVFFSA